MTTSSQAEFNINIHKSKGIGTWRLLYSEFLNELGTPSILEVGSGAPDFLKTLQCRKKLAIDGGDRYREDFENAGIELHVLDLDHGEFPDIRSLDAAVCSDVFEHLMYPLKTLEAIANSLAPDGILFSHVPNEFVWRKTLKIMLGKSNAMYFHTSHPEHSDPHLRRFTKIGYRKFLETSFPHNLFISDMRYTGIARLLNAMKLPVPYCFEGGPTFISTRDEKVYAELQKIKNKLK